jgi:uncharacterized caspase-like protein
VVGTGAYRNVAALPNPAVDGKAMAKLPRNVGFDVVEGANLTRDRMTERLLEFGRKAEGADVALVDAARGGDPVAKPSRQGRCLDNKSARCVLRNVAHEQKPRKRSLPPCSNHRKDKANIRGTAEACRIVRPIRCPSWSAQP